MYSLQKYTGTASRHECPRCHQPHSFTYYVDESGVILNTNVGRCNREDKCGYHYTPKEYFQDNEIFQPMVAIPNTPKPKKSLCFLDTDYMFRSLSYSSNFVYFLCGLFTEEEIERAMRLYYLGAGKDGEVVFWQIDMSGKCRTGKIMQYNPDTGKRIKDAILKVDWVHKHISLPDEWELTQCLFGEHLLHYQRYKSMPVAVVESEKTAIICSCAMPQYLWMATGGSTSSVERKLQALKGRRVILFPDASTDGKYFDKWSGIASRLRAEGFDIQCSDLLERIATQEEKAAGFDIADFIIKEKANPFTDRIREMTLRNPAFGLLIEKFNLEAVA